MTPAEFAADLYARGMELIVRGRSRLWLWPKDAYPFLTDVERAFMREHRAELKALVRAGLPETTVVWAPPSDVPAERTGNPRDVGVPICFFCGRRCVGRDHQAYRILHFRDPAEVARRDAEATAEMRHMVGRKESVWI
jgi:hypothetical protein